MTTSVEFLPSVSGNIEDVVARNKEKGWPDVPAQAKVFVHEYVATGNLNDAVARIDSSRKVGSRLLRDPLVHAYLQHLQEDLVDHTIITRQFVELEMLQTLDEVSGKVDVPQVTKDGEAFMAPIYNPSSKIALLKEMRSLAGVSGNQDGDSGGVKVVINLGDAGYVEPPEVISEQ